MTSALALPFLLHEIRACSLCAAHLPLGPRPIVQAADTARILIIGQAPGTAVHTSGVPWDDPSGDRLRAWTGLDRTTFYDAAQIALMPMGFCYPGKIAGAGDAPPRPECAPKWHDLLRAELQAVRLTLLVGLYAQGAYAQAKPASLTDRVHDQPDLALNLFSLPHPSWRSTGWMTRNSWFERETLPVLRARVAEALG